jgi:hypothetical protein
MMRGLRPFACDTSSLSAPEFLKRGMIPKPSEAVLGGRLSFILITLDWV